MSAAGPPRAADFTVARVADQLAEAYDLAVSRRAARR
jgi:hypothetical protein